MLLVRRCYGELVRLLGHDDPLPVRVWEAIAEAEKRSRGNE